MKCPFCQNLDTQVLDSRVSEDGECIRRRRKCLRCEKRFTTYEQIELRLPVVIKSDGSTEDFQEEKLRLGFKRALHRRPVSNNMLEDSIVNIRNHILSLGLREIKSLLIGEKVMAELIKLDKVAYIRFASVYKDFKSVDDFRNVIKDVQKK